MIFVFTIGSLHWSSQPPANKEMGYSNVLGGHSCNIGNAPNVVGKKLKTAFGELWIYIWYGFTFTKTKKAMGKLKKFSNTYIGQDLRFFCPEETLTISCKITCQSLNFICQTLEESLQSAYQSYRLKECICVWVFPKIWFFLANMQIGNVFVNFINSGCILFLKQVPPALYNMPRSPASDFCH